MCNGLFFYCYVIVICFWEIKYSYWFENGKLKRFYVRIYY